MTHPTQHCVGFSDFGIPMPSLRIFIKSKTTYTITSKTIVIVGLKLVEE
jgi:hypothetical protein